MSHERKSASAAELRRVQERRLEALLRVWMPLASDVKESQSKEAVGVVLKVMERQAALHGLDLKAAKVGDGGAPMPFADPLELAERVRTVSPLLASRVMNGPLGKPA